MYQAPKPKLEEIKVETRSVSYENEDYLCSENFADDDYSGHKNWKQLEPSPEKISQDNQNCNPSYLNSEFKCNVCQKVLSSKLRLKGHKMSHTGLKPFCCVTQDSLKQHLKKHKEGWTD